MLEIASSASYSLAMRGGDPVRGHLDTLVLSAISHGANYGYVIAEWLRTRSGEVFDLPDGTIYPALRRLEEKGLLASRWESIGERRRQSYSLTGKGERALTDGRRAWFRFQRGVGAILGSDA